jgi:peroxiredoxin
MNPVSHIRIFARLVVAVLLAGILSQPARAVPPVGAPFPEITLTAPADGPDLKYLGIGKEGTFTIRDVAAPIVVVECFNIYCPYCQADAPTTVDLFGRIKADPRLSGRVRMIGIGMGNSDYEVGLFKEKYRIPFPLFADTDYAVVGLLDIRYTPTYIVVRLENGKATVVGTRIGRIESIESFLSLLSSLK